MSSERIWFDNVSGFMTEKNYYKFFPTKDMTFAEQLNAILRFTIYFTIIIFIIKKDLNIFLVFIFVAGFTYILYTVDTQNKTHEKFYLQDRNIVEEKHTKKLCTNPSKDNPFMNVLISDYSQDPERKQACDPTKGPTKKLIKKHFDNNLYRDVSDIYNRNASDRNYYTMPSSTIPNDQNTFAQFLYGQDKTCKEGNPNKCYTNIYRSIET